MSSTEEATPPLNGTASSSTGVDTEVTQSLSDSNTSIDLIASRSPSPSLPIIPTTNTEAPQTLTGIISRKRKANGMLHFIFARHRVGPQIPQTRVMWALPVG